jgi:lipoprotein-anchoring transpeptidase ErfK/SrfK
MEAVVRKTFVWVLSFVLVCSLMVPSTVVFAEDTDSIPQEEPQSQPSEGLSEEETEDALTPTDESDPIEDLISEDVEASDSTETSSGFFETMDVTFTPTLAEGRYRIRPAISNVRLIDIANGSTTSRANVQIYQSNNTQAQNFDVSFDDTTGFYTITNVASNKALDIVGGIAKKGTNVQQYTSNNTDAQKWKLVPSTDSYGKEFYTVVSALPGGFVLDVSGAADKNGANVQIYSNNGTLAQKFYFIPENTAITAASTTITPGLYTITSKLSPSLVVDVPGASNANGTQLQIYTNNGTVAQVFDIQPQAGNFYTIKSLNSGSAIDVSGNNIFATTPVVQYKSNGTDAQLWSIEDLGGGVYTFIAKSSGLALDVVNGKASAGSKLQLYYSSGANAQKFTLTPATTDSIFPEIGSITPYTALSKRIDIASGSKSSGANAQVYQSNNTLAQKFEIVRVAPSTYAFRSLVSGLYLTADVAAANVDQQAGTLGAPNANQQWTANWIYGGVQFVNANTGKAMALSGNNIGLVTPAGAAAEAFRVNSANPIETGYYIVKSTGGLALDVSGGSTSNGANVQLYKSNNTDAQKWELKKGSDGYYTFLSPKSKKALDITSGSTASGANIQIYTSNSTAAQKWKIVPAGDGNFYLKSALGYPNTYLAAPGNNAKTTNDPTQAIKFSFTATKYTGYYGTYADVNLTTQKMIYVKNGDLLVESDIVSGAPSMRTPAGTYYVTNKLSPTVLRGPGYAAPVSYWMSFVGNSIGFHDATWQSSFGGSRWTYAGSHGCVNMPLAKAKQLYSVISKGDTVRVHY